LFTCYYKPYDSIARTGFVKHKKIPKYAFTLAEVLITLAIIGVLAVITIPTLLQNIDNKQNKTAWKKTFADLSQASMQILQENSGSFKEVFSDKIDTYASENVKDAFASKLNVIKNCSGPVPLYNGNGNGASKDGCWHMGVGSVRYLNGENQLTESDDTEDSPGLVLSNGSLIRFYIEKSDCSAKIGNVYKCGVIAVDVNGFKKPNTIGKDIFFAYITETSIVPLGFNESYNIATDCVENSTASYNKGYACSLKYLLE